jgi:hypothetical protein
MPRVQKFRAVHVVRMDAANARRRKEHVLGFFRLKKRFDRALPREVQLRHIAEYQIRISFTSQTARDSRADHAGMPGHVYF